MKQILLSANLSGANLYHANLSDTKFDNDTSWPKGFDPKTAGAINVDEQEEEPEDKENDLR